MKPGTIAWWRIFHCSVVEHVIWRRSANNQRNFSLADRHNHPLDPYHSLCMSGSIQIREAADVVNLERPILFRDNQNPTFSDNQRHIVW